MAVHKTYLHVYCEGVDSFGNAKLKDIALPSPHTPEEWEVGWKGWGKLLVCREVEVFVPNFNPVGVEVENLTKEIADLEAKVFVEVKKRKDRINDLLRIGYDSGSATVTEVQNVDTTE